MGAEAGAQAARARALAVLRIRSRALAVALLPAAVAVVLLAGGSTRHLVGPFWHAARWAVTPVAVLVLLAAGGIALVVARARPAVTPTVTIPEDSAPDLYRMVRDLADRLDVPAPSAIALTPDCDSWLEDRTHPAHGPPALVPRTDRDGVPDRDEMAGVRGPHRRTPAAPVLVIGSPFLWWMRVGELRAVLAPVVAGTGPSAHPDIAAARRFVRGLDAAVAVSATPGRCPLTRAVCAGLGWVARFLLRSCREHATQMERGVAAAAAERAQAVDYGLRIVAQEQVGLAYAGWDRLLTRVALPAWRMGRWPSRLDAGVVAALTELSRRDRLAEGFASRLGERPACDLLEEPGAVDEAASLLAARLFHGGPAESGADWSPVDWDEYPDEVVDRKWRTDAARLHRVLDTLGVHRPSDPDGPTLARILDHLSLPPATTASAATASAATASAATASAATASAATASADPVSADAAPGEPAPGDSASRQAAAHAAPDVDPEAVTASAAAGETDSAPAPASEAGAQADVQADLETDLETDLESDLETDPEVENERAAALAALLSAELAREEAAREAAAPAQSSALAPAPQPTAEAPLWDEGTLPLFPLQPPRTARELLADHVTAMVCCAAMDTAGAAPGLDWLDGPSLLVNGERAADLTPRVLSLVEDGDPTPLRDWLLESGIRPEKPVRLV
ncbi:hypothetical protein ACYF6T_20905 [Streptomyces sp. 7R007]